MEKEKQGNYPQREMPDSTDEAGMILDVTHGRRFVGTSLATTSSPAVLWSRARSALAEGEFPPNLLASSPENDEPS
jgi:hypothetical protein